MKISDLSERSRLQLRLDEQPDDIEARRALARLLLQAGDTHRAAQELMAVATVHMARGEGDETLKAARFALGLDPESIEIRLLMAQAYARFPSSEQGRAAQPVEQDGGGPLAAEPVDSGPPQPPTMRNAPVPDKIPRGGSEPLEGAGLAGAQRREAAEEAAWPAVRETPKPPIIELSHEDLELEFSPPTIPARPVESLIRPREESAEAQGPGARQSERSVTPRTPTPGTSSGVASRVEDERREGVTAVTFAHRVLGDDHGLTLESVPPNPLFERLPRDARAMVFEACEVVRYAPGAELVRVDTAVERLILLYEGSVGVGDDVLEPGRLLGEYEFLTEMRARGRAVAQTIVTTLELSAASASALRGSDPQLNDAFVATLRDRVLQDLMTRAPLFASLSLEQRRDLSSRFFSLSVGPGETVMQTGEINRRLFVLLSGELVLDGRRADDGAGRIVLRPGDFFGYVSTVLGRPVQVGVVSSSAAVLLVLPEQEVYRLVAANKGVARAARRELIERGELAVSIDSVSGLGGLRVRRSNK